MADQYDCSVFNFNRSIEAVPCIKLTDERLGWRIADSLAGLGNFPLMKLGLINEYKY
ncbi:hypothetical protein C8R26_10241 [Nitrosomonas oligotropha]|uniref:Uncharacterized protein n=1 Tax=Nitrosomonas oligotropha TaxID=42354 RepID=A0A2T5I3T1_9PROT|nr:hypothetical protein C8R26_10241 [Nitrosomonas oligotropha]